MPANNIDGCWKPMPDGRRVRASLVVCRDGTPAPPGLVRRSDEVSLLMEIAPPRAPGTAAVLRVELYRGEVLRDRRSEALPATQTETVVLAYDLGRGTGAGKSSRLRCCLWLGVWPVGEVVVLLGGGVADAQGRLSDVAGEASPATLLAAVETLNRATGGGG